MKYWGIAILGLAMSSKELPPVEGLLCLENPEIGSGVQLDDQYTLEDIAQLHLKQIQEIYLNLKDHFLYLE